ncbi:hypothetical protein B0H65DRAFT_436037 [Neurospora tetraspora]|uniref:Uncharacterized protein n=1 Tax=Neurospora tetraspora TaxID=94610 RepID=A0AAE0J1X1_9PEZI|nr:hypothetical protein B0H65DRAFT_436037 [Neurospora tetraspora]
MRLVASLPVAVLLAAAEVIMATPSPSITAAPTTSNNLLKTFITTASNCTHTAPTDSIHRRNPELITSAPAVTTPAKPSVFTTVTCHGDYGEEDGYVKHRCKVYEYRLKELESSAGCAVPLLGGVWGMAGVLVAAMAILF